MRKLSVLVVFAALVFSGCDSNSSGDNSNELSATQKLTSKTWVMTGVSDSEGDKFDTFASNFSSIIVTFSADTFRIVVDPADNSENTIITGGYTVDESLKRLSLSAQVTPETSVPLNFTYNFVNDDSQVDIAADGTTSTLLNSLFGTTLVGNATLTLTDSSLIG
jgi:hypothetical protein